MEHALPGSARRLAPEEIVPDTCRHCPSAHARCPSPGHAPRACARRCARTAVAPTHRALRRPGARELWASRGASTATVVYDDTASLSTERALAPSPRGQGAQPAGAGSAGTLGRASPSEPLRGIPGRLTPLAATSEHSGAARALAPAGEEVRSAAREERGADGRAGGGERWLGVGAEGAGGDALAGAPGVQREGREGPEEEGRAGVDEDGGGGAEGRERRAEEEEEGTGRSGTEQDGAEGNVAAQEGGGAEGDVAAHNAVVGEGPEAQVAGPGAATLGVPGDSAQRGRDAPALEADPSIWPASADRGGAAPRAERASWGGAPGAEAALVGISDEVDALLRQLAEGTARPSPQQDGAPAPAQQRRAVTARASPQVDGWARRRASARLLLRPASALGGLALLPRQPTEPCSEPLAAPPAELLAAPPAAPPAAPRAAPHAAPNAAPPSAERAAERASGGARPFVQFPTARGMCAGWTLGPPLPDAAGLRDAGDPGGVKAKERARYLAEQLVQRAHVALEVGGDFGEAARLMRLAEEELLAARLRGLFRPFDPFLARPPARRALADRRCRRVLRRDWTPGARRRLGQDAAGAGPAHRPLRARRGGTADVYQAHALPHALPRNALAGRRVSLEGGGGLARVWREGGGWGAGPTARGTGGASSGPGAARPPARAGAGRGGRRDADGRGAGRGGGGGGAGGGAPGGARGGALPPPLVLLPEHPGPSCPRLPRPTRPRLAPAVR
jgi:hypothetical protein